MIAISTMTYMLLKPSEALQRLDEAGVKEVELSFDNFQFFKKSGVSYDSLLTGVKETSSTLKLDVIAAHLPYGELLNRAVNPLEQPKVINDLSKWLGVFSELGVKTVAVHIPFNHVLIGEDSLTYPQRIKEVNKDFFKKLAYIGREFSLTLAVENRYERGIYGYLPKDLIELVNNINDDHLKICLDTGHSVINGFQPSEYYKSLHPYVALIHAHDNDCSKDLHLPPYTGCIDWDSFLNTLKEFKYNNIMVFEVACSDSLRRCDNMVVVLKMLRDLFRSKLI